jgi:hypothetical protein
MLGTSASWRRSFGEAELTGEGVAWYGELLYDQAL